MEEIKRLNHNVIIEDRKRFTLTGIKEVISFDEETVVLNSSLGKLVIKGNNLHILDFTSESADLAGEGKIHAVIYTADESSGGFWSRLFR